MNYKNLKIILPLLVAIGLVGVGGIFLGQTFTSNPVSETPGLHAIHVGFVTSSGACKNGDEACLTGIVAKSHNVYTNLGKNATRDYLFHSGANLVNAFNVISVGQINVSQTATDRCLANNTGAGSYCQDWYGNGLTSIAGTVADVVSGGGIDFGNVSISKTFTCTLCVSTVINATGLYNKTFAADALGNPAATDLMLFAEANFTAATLQTNDQINVTWFIWTN